MLSVEYIGDLFGDASMNLSSDIYPELWRSIIKGRQETKISAFGETPTACG